MEPPTSSPILPAGAAGSENVPPVTPGPDLNARDYRADPSLGQTETEGLLSIGRDRPNAGGTPVPPVPDRTIQSYDLPDQLATYDRMTGD